MTGSKTVLAINPGSTSTKVGLFTRDREVLSMTLEHEGLSLGPSGAIMDQLPMRTKALNAFLSDDPSSLSGLGAVAGRGGLLRPLEGGTYLVNEAMMTDLKEAGRGEHASNLGAFMAHEMAMLHGVPAFVVDPVSVDELQPVARLSGVDGMERVSLSHALNSRAAARNHARSISRSYGELRLVVAHLGSGISVSAHRDGRMVDVNNSMEEGPFAMDRAGGVPVMRLLDMTGTTPVIDLRRRLFGEGGVFSYLGTRDLRDVTGRMAEGDEKAGLVFDAMVYQTAKEIGAMATVLDGRLDAVILTGGMANETKVVNRLRDAVGFIAPLVVIPGEDELRSLADGAFRVLDGEEDARVYG